MKIDIHAHTKKCKSGDATTREISPDGLREAILPTEVRIIAITNHNYFNLEQYTKIITILKSEVQVWPGIELDIHDNNSRGHLLVIVSPTLAEKFSEVVDSLVTGSTPDNFTITIEGVLKNFDGFSPLYVAHYKQKKPNLSDGALEKLLSGTRNPACVIKEVTNSISAGIYISHGHASIYGSDVQDWSKYEDIARELPDLRLPVDSFEHFCLLLQKDPTTINTILDKKNPETLDLTPFEDDGDTHLQIKTFDDINIIFGPKGTGKTCILRNIAAYYKGRGTDASVYESASDRLDKIFDTTGKNLKINLNDYDINYCSDEIETLRKAEEVGVTSLSEYITYFSLENMNRNAKKILLKDIEPEDFIKDERKFNDINKAVETTAKFLKFLGQDSFVKAELAEHEHKQVAKILSDLLQKLRHRKKTSFFEWKAIYFLNSAIKIFRKEVERKTGSPAKPITTGFYDFAKNRIKIKTNAIQILKSVDTKIPIIKEIVGSLDANKGELWFSTEFQFHNGSVADGSLHSLTSARKTTQKAFVNCVRKIHEHTYADDLFQYISKLNEVEGVEEIKTVNELLLFKRVFVLKDVPYSPSSGESSMVMLQKELDRDKSIYILDEPERSLGNEYISNVIVPKLKDLARAGKKVFISTHDANIAVRTLPYSSIYRCHGQSGYKTYIGNPFSNNLLNLDDKDDQLDWKTISMKTLEGGEEAFGERGKIYGNR